MDSHSDRTKTFCHSVSEVERDFKRLKVDESEHMFVSKAKCDHSSDRSVRTSNYFSSKSSPYSPKIGCPEKKSSATAFRRQRLHLSTKTQPKARPNDETPQTSDKDITVFKDFSDLRLSCDEKSSQSVDESESKRQHFFNRNYKFDSSEWRSDGDKGLAKHKTVSSDNRRLKKSMVSEDKSCARQAIDPLCDASADELAAYLDDTLFLPRKMSFMAEMMYT